MGASFLFLEKVLLFYGCAFLNIYLLYTEQVVYSNIDLYF